MYIPTAMLLDCIFQTWHWYWLSQRRGWTSKIDSIQLKMCPKHLSYHSNCTDCLPWAKEDLWFHTSKSNLHRNIIYERLIAVFDWMFLEGLCQGCVAQFVISSLRNRTVERRRRQNAWAWQTWRDYHLRVLSRIHLKLMFLTLLQKDLFKGMWSLAEAKQKQNYCHACHTRFAVVFPLPSCCVSSLLLPITCPHLDSRELKQQRRRR